MSQSISVIMMLGRHTAIRICAQAQLYLWPGHTLPAPIIGNCRRCGVHNTCDMGIGVAALGHDFCKLHGADINIVLNFSQQESADAADFDILG